MSEMFFCKGEMVHMTNGGCHELYLAWGECAGVLNYFRLRQLLIDRAECGSGSAADGIDEEYLMEEFNDFKIKKHFHDVMLMLIYEITSFGSIALKMDVNWDSDIQNYWLEKLKKIEKALKIQLQS
jgi:hypothetical protein